MALETDNVMLVKNIEVEWNQELYNELVSYSYEWAEDSSLMVDIWLVFGDGEVTLPKELQEEFDSCRDQGYTFIALNWK